MLAAKLSAWALEAAMFACLSVSGQRLPTPSPDPSKLALIVKNASRPDGMIVVEPVTPVLFGVRVDSGSAALAVGDVLNCTLKAKNVAATANDGGKTKLATLLFDCGKTKLAFAQLGVEMQETVR